MRTPICDFVKSYAECGKVRMHMPGHKGAGEAERLDITEVAGADSLFDADGIIRESEEIASELFGAKTFYSTEGSSLCIRAMVHLICCYAASCGKEPHILAARNVHGSFVSALALSGCAVDWIYGKESYLSCEVTADDLKEYIERTGTVPTALYLTSPDYLGRTCDIAELAAACRERGILLAVDNAHGAYLKFLAPSMHPIDLGAHICCDSAHKTLHALTGAAYLHVSHDAPPMLSDMAKRAMSLYASTSPSYLILQSLDRLNAIISDGFSAKLTTFVDKIEEIKRELETVGYSLCSNEPMKITIKSKAHGYLGTQLAQGLSERGVEVEFADCDYVVLMPSVSNTDTELRMMLSALKDVKRLPKIENAPPSPTVPERVMTVREAVFAPCERVCASDSVGRVLSAASVGCPPAVPILVSGERVDESAKKIFAYYGINEILAVARSEITKK